MRFYVALIAIFGLAAGIYFLYQVGGEHEPYVLAESAVEAGKYIALIGGCNDCHTKGWSESDGNVPMEDWLTGNDVGFKGPWGTTYASNLRLFVRNLSEADWVDMLRTRMQSPPMPWMNVRQLSDRDMRALYKFIRDLGPKGVAAPAYVAPDQQPTAPYIEMEPRFPE